MRACLKMNSSSPAMLDVGGPDTTPRRLPEHAPDDGRFLECALVGWWERVDARTEYGKHRVGQSRWNGTRHAPGRTLANQHSAAHHSTDDLFKEQGITVCGGDEIAPERLWHFAAFEDLGQQRGTLLCRQCAERQHRGPLATFAELGVSLPKLGPGGGDHEHRPGRPRQKPYNHFNEAICGPMQIPH